MHEDISVSTKLGIYLFDLLKIHPSLGVSGCAYKILQLDSNQQLKFPVKKLKYQKTKTKKPNTNREGSKSRRIGLVPFFSRSTSWQPGDQEWVGAAKQDWPHVS